MDDKRVGAFDRIVLNNSVLVKAVGIGPLAAAAATLKQGLAFSVIMLFLLFGTNLAVYYAGGFIHEKFQKPFYCMLSSVLILPAYFICDGFLPSIISLLGIYAPLMIVNSMVLSSEKYSDRETVSVAFIIKDTLLVWIGYSLIAVILSGARELIMFGTLLGELPGGVQISANGAAKTFFGFIMLAFLAAAVKAVKNR